MLELWVLQSTVAPPENSNPNLKSCLISRKGLIDLSQTGFFILARGNHSCMNEHMDVALVLRRKLSKKDIFNT